MATFLEVATWAGSPVIQQRVRGAMVKVAIQISGEGIGSMSELQTKKRQQMAFAVLSGGLNVHQWTIAVMNNATIQNAGVTGDPPDSNAPDGDIEFVLTEIWDDMAGITTAEKVVIEPE